MHNRFIRRIGESQKPYYLHNIITMILLILLLVIGTTFFIRNIRYRSIENSSLTLRTVSTETSKVVTETLQSKVDFLNSIWMGIRGLEGDARRKAIVDQQKRSDIYGFERIGFTDTAGIGYTSEGNALNLSDEKLFRENMNGNICIAKRSLAAEDGQFHDVVIVSIPAYGEDGELEGILYQLFSMETFRSLMDTSAFDGQAMTALLNSNGDIVMATDGVVYQEEENVLSSLIERGDTNLHFVEQLTDDLKHGRSGEGRYYVEAGYRVCYYSPIHLTSGDSTALWCLVSILPKSVQDNFSDGLLQSSLWMSATIAGFVLLFSLQIFLMQRKMQRELEVLAYQDPLTGGENYTSFKRKFDILRGKGGCLITCDIMDFKLINRYWGAEKGDEVLKELGELFSGLANVKDLTAHISDDLFIFYFSEMPLDCAPAKCMELYEQVVDLLRNLGINQSFPVFGFCAVDGSEPIERYRSRSMFAKKEAKVNRAIYRAYDDVAAENLMKSMRILEQFGRDLEKNGFEIWYQPKYNLKDGCVASAEALVRWRDQDGKIFPPIRFIPLLEEKGMIFQMDRYVFAEVCRQQKERFDSGIPVVPVSVNVSRGSLLHPHIESIYKQILAESGVDPALVCLEITEDSVEENVMGVIQAFRNEGFCVLMDDFGKGNSNLANLRRDLFDGIKFDKSLIDLIGSKEGASILRHSIQMAHDIGLLVTAEGVETEEQVCSLMKMQCDEIQGFYYYQPMDGKSFDSLLHAIDRVIP